MTQGRQPEPQRPRVCFLAHAADRTGPPIVLLHFLRWVAANTDWEIINVLLRGGDLLGDFEALGETIVLGDPAVGRPATPEEAERERARNAERRQQLAHLTDLSLVYVNTAWSIHGLPYLPEDPDRPTVAAVHELEHDLRDTMPPASLAQLVGLPHHFIAGADVIAANLVANHGVPADRITVVTESIELPDLSGAPAFSRAEVGIAPDAFVVTTVSAPVWRKAPDLVVWLCWMLQQRRPDISLHFRWIGADAANPIDDLVGPLADRDRLGLEGVLEFVPTTPQVFDHLRLSDMFLLPSREDACPLVCLEAGAVGLPIVCFDNGGIPDLVADDGGMVVPYPDLDAMADAVALLHDQPEQRVAMGAAVQARVRQEHDMTGAGPRLFAAISRWLR